MPSTGLCMLSIFGEEHELTKNPSLCQNYTNFTSHHVSDLSFLNAIYYVGNYGKLFDGETNNPGMNKLNHRASKMIYATPFDELENKDDYLLNPTAGNPLLDKIKKKGWLNCGLIVPDGFDGDIEESDMLVDMIVDYCCALTAVPFNGDIKAAILSTFLGNDMSYFVALNNGTIHALAGGRIGQKYDLESSSPFIGFLFFYALPLWQWNCRVSHHCMIC